MPTPQPVAPISVYVVGDTATITVEVTLPQTPPKGYPSGSPATYVDPGAITVGVQPPAGGETDPYVLTYGTDSALARLSLGVYQVTIPIGLGDVGKWLVRWHSTANGDNQGAGVREWLFETVPSRLANPN